MDKLLIAATLDSTRDSDSIVGAQEKVKQDAANELIFAVVGHVGSGTSVIARQLKDVLEDTSIGEIPIDVELIKARTFLDQWAQNNGLTKPTSTGIDLVQWYQDVGDRMRRESTDFSVVARMFALDIRSIRAQKTGQTLKENKPILPDGKPRAYILDSIRHPDEVRLLQHIYQDAFVLIGVVCEEEMRVRRLASKYSDGGIKNCRKLMHRDDQAGLAYGQRTRDAFHMADFFVDNSIDRTITEGGETRANQDWEIVAKLERLAKILSRSEIIRPTIEETAMHHAYSAQLRSACLSRQVGAALIDTHGNLLASGTNEVPIAGGGVYGENPDGVATRLASDHRCAFRGSKYCSNTREQNDIILDAVESIGAVVKLGQKENDIAEVLRNGRIGELLEFSRAVHAEMDALLSAARASRQIRGSRLFVTTFPCHFCARHIVTAGVDEVQYIEPFPKSAALRLHSDAISTTWLKWKAPSSGGSKVLFRPFSGVAPRMYRRAFSKDRELKDKESGNLSISDSGWAGPWHLGRSSYVTLEAELL